MKPMYNQLSLFDLPGVERFDPVRAVAKMASPYWTDSIRRLKELNKKNPTEDRWTTAVKKEYCPYGFVGHYGASRGFPDVEAYEMRAGKILIEYYDEEGQRHSKKATWSEFAHEIGVMIANGALKERGD